MSYNIILLFKIIVLTPVIALSSCTVGGYLGGFGQFNIFMGVISSVIALIAFGIWDGKKEKVRFLNHVTSLGINPEYIISFVESGLAIDKTNEKLFAGDIKKGKVFEFKEISSIEWEDEPRGNDIHYLININTKNFDMPTLAVWFGRNRSGREQAYAKLRAALDMS